MFAASKTAVVSGAAPDDKFNYVTMLLHGDGTNGAQNNTFVDSGPNTLSITRNGNTTQGSFSPYGSNWSNHFDGTGDYLSTPNVSALQVGTSTNPFCVECWVYPTSTPASDIAILGNYKVTSYPTNTDGFDILQTSSNRAALRWGYPNYADSGVSAVMTLNTWNHIAVCRNSSGSMSCYLNGTRWFNTSTNTSITNATASSFWVGWAGNLSGSTINPFNGYISNVRLVKGSAVYDPTSSTLTVPTSPLTAVTNTSLLTCQSNRFVDSSASPLTMTPSGNTSVQRFNPFGTSTAYSTSVIGGSGYFDGTGDYLTTPSSSALGFGTGDFTIECWTYLRDSNALYVFDMRFSSGADTYVYITATALEAAVNGVSLSVTGVNFLNNWAHIAVVRASGTVKIYVNGVQQATDTSSGSIANSGIAVGARFTGTESFNGYISNFRIVKGTAVYTSAFTPPTAPVTAITNTSLLLNYTNGAIFDNAMMHDLETRGNAQISTSVKKYGTGSLAFDGSGDYLYIPNTPSLRLSSTGAFTIEFWVNPSALSSDQHVIHAYNNSSPNQGWAFGFGSGGVANTSLAFYDGGSWRTVSTGFSTGTWYHIAVSSQGSSNTGRLFLNGVQQGSAFSVSSSIANSATPIAIGAQYTGSFPFNGYIDDLRITNGYARYTANFTPPTLALSDTGPI
jgi:hypothetical protein